jgi:hypothetical protein
MKTKEELLKSMKSNGGYIIYDDMPDMIEKFGADFRIVVKYWEHPRETITLSELWEMEKDQENKSEKAKDIKEVFISADTYDRLFGK